ncbi:6-carboxytetrahydropterin synthase QueD [Thiopseudomonas alkaliphila]|uniref:6-carboxytetrahydropterin synthase QueD n=1 Tax=Thiopseudomonas alkaliphila TaxID=1697053 RepID=UPI002575B5EF|nr:6-carboxytetrahydropterin synthase QueD [Thiopseudomonas alkaliphila]MDM1707322.1 6-carboxytetrahydropterin synthase QueD [Thiopseudomonas alkaliphila]
MKIVKHFSFNSAHLLDCHDGKCQNLHGHTYQLEVEVQGPLIKSGPKAGMVLDFADLKQAVKQQIVDHLDHAFIYDIHSEKESTIAQLLQSWQMKTFAFKGRTTAEMLSQFIFDQLSTKLPISRIRLYETPSSYAECNSSSSKEASDD